MPSFLPALLGSANERQLKRVRPIAHDAGALEAKLQELPAEAFPEKTAEFKQRLAAEEVTLDDLLPEAFAYVREAARRTIGLRHFDVQCLGGIVLHQGKISEMKTGEGKTLVATLPLYRNALEGKGTHLVTVNDYLARRDVQWMGPIYQFLGLTVASIIHDASFQFDLAYIPKDYRFLHLRPIERRDAYRADITYGTNNEFGFDYLRDNMKFSLDEYVQRELHYAIVDEVDNILIDEARTPLIISGPAEESTDRYYVVDRIIPRLRKDTDYTIDEKHRSATLTEEGIAKCERLLGVSNLYDPSQIDMLHHVTQALKAHTLFKRDVDYVVKDGEVLIVDEFTGRLMPGRRWSDGLHQAVEAKDGVKHNVLNAINHEAEANIIAQAGRHAQVTIATNMAGRGTDILLGGNPEFLARSEMENEWIRRAGSFEGGSKAERYEDALRTLRERYDEEVQRAGEKFQKELAALEERRGDALRRLTDAHRKILDFSPYRAIRARYEEVSSVELIPAVRDRDPIPERYRRVKAELETTLLAADAGGAVATERSALEDLRARYEAALAAWEEGGGRTAEAGREPDERRPECEP